MEMTMKELQQASNDDERCNVLGNCSRNRLREIDKYLKVKNYYNLTKQALIEDIIQKFKEENKDETKDFNENKDEKKSDLKIEKKESAFKSSVETFEINNTIGSKDPVTFLNECEILLRNTIDEKIAEHNSIKTYISLKCNMKNQDVTHEAHFRTKSIPLLESNNIEDTLKEQFEKIMEHFATYQQKGSGWTLHEILHLEMTADKYNPLRGSSYIELPDIIKKKQACINVENKDDKCFLWSILSAMHPVDRNPDRVSKYTKYEHDYDYALEGISFPVKITDIEKFENRVDLSINLYAYDEKYLIYPLHLTKKKDTVPHINLLYVKDEKKSHYCWIKDLSRLGWSQLSKKKVKKYICERCLAFFDNEEKLSEHKILCNDIEHGGRPILPKPGSVIQFKNYHKSLRVPFIIAADFECKLTKIHSCQPDPSQSYTNQYQKHDPISYCYYIISTYVENIEPRLYRGVNAANHFIKSLKKDMRWIYDNYLKMNRPMNPLTERQQEDHDAADACYICRNEFSEENKKIYEHDHYTGEYRGPACNNCNLQYKN